MAEVIVPSRLRHLGRRADEPALVRQLREELREKVRRVESTMLSLDNLVSPLDWLDAGDGFPGFGSWRWNRPVDRTQDRTHAPLNYLNEQEWRLQLAMSRDLCVRNHLALGFRDHVCNFVGPVQIAFVLRGQSPGATAAGPTAADGTDTAAVDPLVRQVQQVWDEWREFAEWGEGEQDREEECRRRLIVEGEATLRFFAGDGNSDGLPYARHVEPELIRTPPGHSTQDEWGWGILSDVGDDENVKAIWQCTPDNVNDGRPVPASEWVRAKANGDRTTRRGLSDFFPVGEQLRKVYGLLDNMAHVARLQAAIAWWEKYPTATLTQLQNMVTLGQDYSRTKMPPNTSGGGTSVNSYEAGTVVRTEQRDVLPGPVSAPEAFKGVHDLVMRGLAFRWGMPSYIFGESESSFASTLVEGAPFVRAVEERQKRQIGFSCKVAMRVIEFAERTGRLPRGASKRVRAVGTARPVVIADEEKQARTFLSLYEKNCADPVEYIRKRGGDPKVVAANILAWQKKFPGAQAPAPAPGGAGRSGATQDPNSTPPGSACGDGSSPNEPDESADAPKSIFGAKESLDASGHEHGADGRFGSGGTGKKPSGAARDNLRNAEDVALDAKERSLIAARKKELARDRKKTDAATERTRDKEDAKRQRERDRELEKIDAAEERDPRTAENQKAEAEMFDRQTAEEQDLVTRYAAEVAATKAALGQRQAAGEISAGDVQGELGALSARHHRELKHLRLKHADEEDTFDEAHDLGYDAQRDAAQERWDAEDDAIGDRRAEEDAAREDAREKEDDAIDSETHPDIAAERAALQSRRDAEDDAAEGGDDPAPVPVADLARNSGADNAHLDALAAAETDPQTKDYLETAAFNLPGPDDDAIAHADGIYDKTFPTDHEARRFATVAQLKMQQRAATKAGHAAAADRLDQVIKAFGPTRGIESIFGPRVAAATDLARRALVRWLTERRFTGIDSNGHHWRDGKQVKANQSDSGGTRGGFAKGLAASSASSGPELSDEEKKGVSDGIDDDVAALPEDRRPDAGTVAKAKELALAAVAKAYFWAERVQATRAFGLVTRALDAYLDNPTDLLTKIGYNPNNSSGTAGPQVADAVRDATGVSGHLVAKVAAVVLTKAVFAVKKRLAGAPTGGTTETDESAAAFAAWAEFVSQLLAHLTEQLGASAPVPDAATVETALRSLVANR